MKFFDVMTTKDTLTENAMVTHSTSGSPILDFFFRMGGMRGQPNEDVLKAFLLAWAEDSELALRALFCLRNVRGGMGERHTFRIILYWLAKNYPEVVEENLHNIPRFGRWDDVLVCLKTPVEDAALDMIFSALKDGDKLAAKWMPREGKRLHEIAIYLAEKFGLSRREYRLLLSQNTEVVENLMCSGQWDKIKFGHVPSVAFKKYRKAFKRQQPERFEVFLDQVDAGEDKVNAGAIFPHEVIRELFGWVTESLVRVTEAQWQFLPEYGAPSGTLVVSDVSGSMDGRPLEVSIALGLYFAERLEGPFKNTLVTFSARPEFFKLPDGNIADKINSIRHMDWGMNTNLEAVFALMLGQAVKHNLSQEQMPGNILIISDMQFDECMENADHTAMEMMRAKYAHAGYDFPNVIFWNVRTSSGVPAKMNEAGVALLSGYSPSLMKAVMGGVADPMSIMLKTLNDEMYDCVVL